MKLVHETLEFAQRAIDQSPKIHRTALTRELDGLRAKWLDEAASLKPNSNGGAAAFWKRYRENQEFRITSDDGTINEVLRGISAVADRYGITAASLKRRIDKGRGECTLTCRAPEDLNAHSDVTITITRSNS